jgi:hypothetical protein
VLFVVLLLRVCRDSSVHESAGHMASGSWSRCEKSESGSTDDQGRVCGRASARPHKILLLATPRLMAVRGRELPFSYPPKLSNKPFARSLQSQCSDCMSRCHVSFASLSIDHSQQFLQDTRACGSHGSDQC